MSTVTFRETRSFPSSSSSFLKVAPGKEDRQSELPSASTLSIQGILHKKGAGASFSIEGERISLKEKGLRIQFFSTEDTRTSVRVTRLANQVLTESICKLRVNNKESVSEFVVNLEYLSRRLHLPLEELIRAAQENKLESYLESKKDHIEKLPLLLDHLNTIEKYYETILANDPKKEEIRNELMKMVIYAFSYPKEIDDFDGYYLQMKENDIFLSEECPSLEQTILLVNKEPNQSISFYHVIKKLGEGSFGIVLLIWNFTLSKKETVKTDKNGNETVEEEGRFSFEMTRRASDSSLNLRKSDSANSLDIEGIQSSPRMLRRCGKSSSRTHLLFGPFYEAGDLYKAYETLTLENKKLIFTKLSKGLLNLFTLEVTHSDINPKNVLLHQNEGAAFSDLGSAKFSDTMDLNKRPSSTAGYMSFDDLLAINAELKKEKKDIKKLYEVEQLHDVFSAGCTFFYLFTGINLFQLEGVKTGPLAIKFSKIEDLKEKKTGKTIKELLEVAGASEDIIIIIETMIQFKQSDRLDWKKLVEKYLEGK